ncbi:MAG: DUF2236 domain-containing protein [Rhodobiaceae bacterium]|nr:DUF2236 domain-containing protein [Rhodobiaceae bacterium]
MARSAALDEILTLDPIRDNERIVYLSAACDFPFDMTRALELALFRTYCVPSISGLLERTGKFIERPQQRFDDTDIILSEILEHGHSSARGRQAIEQMNAAHGRFRIANDDFLYVLSTFIFEPIRWNRRFGWRPMHVKEREALFQFWSAVGELMGIDQIPGDIDAFEAFNIAYESRNFRYSAANARIGAVTIDLFVGRGPGFAAPLMRRAIMAFLDEPLLKAFGFSAPTTFERFLAINALRLRAIALRVLPHRRTPISRMALRRPSYPQGYDIETLGRS